MSEVKFTKGPWKAVPDTLTRIPDKIYRVVGPSDVVCGDDGICCHDHYNDRSFEEDRANMHLISSAPELYEALEKILNEYLDVDLLNDEPETMTDACRLARNALSKARGEHK